MTYLQLIFDAWSRDFNHAEYLRYAKAIADMSHSKPHTVSERVYNLITEGLELDMEEHIGFGQIESTDLPDTTITTSVYTDPQGNPY